MRAVLSRFARQHRLSNAALDSLCGIVSGLIQHAVAPHLPREEDAAHEAMTILESATQIDSPLPRESPDHDAPTVYDPPTQDAPAQSSTRLGFLDDDALRSPQPLAIVDADPPQHEAPATERSPVSQQATPVAAWTMPPKETRGRTQSALCDVLDGALVAQRQIVLETHAFRVFELDAHDEDRYAPLGLLGEGGMGEVQRVFDRDLGRTVAMKTMHASLMKNPALLARFIEEAQIGAQLQHPGIIPIHELGELPDGRFYFTMREVRGQNLRQTLRDENADWSLRGLLNIFLRVCEAVGYAHARGVVHRDLKPDNIMLCDHGEVLVVDWGIAKVLGRAEVESEQVTTQRAQHGGLATISGAIAGTPSYMPPEQALGSLDQIDARSDVYALGSMLYELLCGRPPHVGPNARSILLQLIQNDPAPVQQLTDTPLPEVLVEVCHRALSRDPRDRFDDARALANAISQWLEGSQRRAKAQIFIDEAHALGEQAERTRRSAQALAREARTSLEPVAPHAAEATKHAGWEKEDAARELERQAIRADVQREQRLQTALIHAPDHLPARRAIADHYAERHRIAEEKGLDDDVAHAEVFLQTHSAALPESDPLRQRLTRYLEGIGELTLHTQPEGASALLYRFTPQHRRWIPEFVRDLGLTPLREVPLPPGRYLIELRHEGHALTRYPVHIQRLERWDGVPPGASTPQPVVLPREGLLKPDSIHVPAGWFQIGSVQSIPGAHAPARLWVEDFAIARHPVTNADYITFLDALVDAGREDDALTHVPRERGAAGPGEPIYGRDARGHFVLQPDADGDIWQPDWPALMISWSSARAYGEWRAEETGLPWRLPSEFEWEKAARGVDARPFPWGDWLDPSWCGMRQSRPGRPLPTSIHDFPVDESPYGVRGLAGNCKDWCLERFDAPLPTGIVCPPKIDVADPSVGRVVRGGSWTATEQGCLLAVRSSVRPAAMFLNIGLRLARPLDLKAGG